ncbi:vacuolar protein sorting-associated protein 37A isoform X1 [Atheta coriaria]|uniref:vacuolar protein sorting-associated protein 37A isoform X1 n=1 Tax=Dalotia coriaria TaxID=877792 RepID=UPI0031F3F77B
MLSRIYRTEPDTRWRQINTLKVFNDNVIEIQEGQEYQVLFKSGSNDLVLSVSLSNEFPKDKPFIKIKPIVFHQWVAGDGEVTGAPGLINFTVHSDLGRVVQAIIREFERTPPPLQESCSLSTSPSITNRIQPDVDIMGRASPNYFNHNYPTTTTTTSNTPASSYQSAAFPELSAMSNDELKQLNESVERQEDFLENLPQNKETNKIIDDLILQIEELADSNLSKQPLLEDLKKDINTRIEEVTKLAFETERLNMAYQTISEKYSPKNIKNKLQFAAEEANVRSEAIAEQFLQGQMDVEKFVVEYIQSRSLAQARKTKEEKLSQQLENLERAGF